uniref:Uncharacterized protein n=1 Tax=Compsopogon caeruleus TaxID=31354 RepID=A0A7S1TJ85_9RHOD
MREDVARDMRGDLESSGSFSRSGEGSGEAAARGTADSGELNAGQPRIRLSQEEIERAKQKREKDQVEELERKEKQGEKLSGFVEGAKNIAGVVGEKVGVFDLGVKARTKLEAAIDEAEKTEPVTSSDKLKRSAARAAKQLGATASTTWTSKILPTIRARLPGPIKDLSDTSLTAIAVGFVVGVVLLPSVFGDGRAPPAPEKKAIDDQTARIRSKLKEPTISTPSSIAERPNTTGVFPPERNQKVTEVPVAPRPSTSYTRPQTKPVADGSESGVSASPSNEKKPVSSENQKPVSSEDRKTVSSEASSTSTTAVAPASTQVPKPAPPVSKPTAVPSGDLVGIVRKEVGPQQNLILSAVSDSLADSTVQVEMAKEFSSLPRDSKIDIVKRALKAARSAGFENVSFVNRAGDTVASAGIDVEFSEDRLRDRSELRALQKEKEALAADNSSLRTATDVLQNELEQTNDSIVSMKEEYNKSLASLKKENLSMSEQIQDLTKEVGQMPDRAALEARVIDAEKENVRLTDAVDALSRQVGRARDAEETAIKDRDQAKQALAAAEEREAQAREAGERRAAELEAKFNNSLKSEIEKVRAESQLEVAKVQESSNQSIQAQEAKLKQVVDELSRVKEESAKQISGLEVRLEEGRLASEKRLEAAIQTEREKSQNAIASIRSEADQAIESYKKELASQKASSEKLIREEQKSSNELRQKLERVEKSSKVEKLRLEEQIRTLRARRQDTSASPNVTEGGSTTAPAQSTDAGQVNP